MKKQIKWSRETVHKRAEAKMLKALKIFKFGWSQLTQGLKAFENMDSRQRDAHVLALAKKWIRREEVQNG